MSGRCVASTVVVPGARVVPVQPLVPTRAAALASSRGKRGQRLGSALLRRRNSSRPDAAHACRASYRQANAASVELGRDVDTGIVTDDLLNDFVAGYKCLNEEMQYWIDPAMVDGEIPEELSGTLFRNGPGLFEIGGKKINQPFDGDGMICKFAFKDGRVLFQNKFVKTKGYVEEQKAGRALFKGAFSTGNPSGKGLANPFDFDLKNVANTHVVQWGGKLYALWEGGLPHELDPVTLETVGETRWNGAIQGGEFAAHFRTVEAPNGKRFVNFGAGVSGTDAAVTFYEFDEAGQCIHTSKVVLKGGAFGFYHDFLVTENYYVLYENPVNLDLMTFASEYMFSKCGIAQCLKFDTGKPTKIHVVPRGVKNPTVQTLVTLPFFTFHHANAYEEGDKIICDSIPWRKVDFSFNIDNLIPSNYNGGQRSESWRIELDVRRGTVRRTKLQQRSCEFPVVSPKVAGKKHKHFYCLAAQMDHPELWGPAQCLMKVSVEQGVDAPEPVAVTDTWYAGRRSFPGEPVFVPRPNGNAEDDGWVLLQVYDAGKDRSSLVILDATNVSGGPVAKINLEHHIPPGLHGSWCDKYWG